MPYVLLVLAGVWVGYLLYTRYFPVRGVKCVNKTELKNKATIVDLRDYSESAKEVVIGAIALPIAYIKRHHHGLPQREIYVVASDRVERNIGIRLLQRSGHRVAGYSIINDPCRCKKYLAEFAS